MRAHFYISVVCLLLSSCATMREPLLTQKHTDAQAGATPWKKLFTDSLLIAHIDTALAANPDVLIAFQRLEAASAAFHATHWALFPHASARASLGQRRFGAYTMDGVGNYDTRLSPNITDAQLIPEHLPDYFIGLQMGWEIDIWGKLRNRREAARARYLRQAEGRNWVMSNLVAAVASTYYELLSLDREMEILEEFITLQENAELVISYQKLAGQTTELAVQQFRAQTLNAKNMRVETRQRIVDAENRMNTLLGKFPGAVRRSMTAFNDTLAVPDEIPAQLAARRPDIRAAEQQIRESGLNVESARAAFLPSFTLEGLLGFQSFNPAFFLSPASITYNILGALTAPLINRAGIESDLRIARSSQRAAILEYRKTVLTAYAEVATELAHLRNLETMYAYKDAEAQVNRAAVETANALFRTGRATYLEVIITQKNALLTNLQLVNLRERQLKAAVRLYKASGGGWK